jgi:hypothetical protein
MKNNEKKHMLGYPSYPEGEDVYNKLKKEGTIEPDDVSQKKAAVENEEEYSELEIPKTLDGHDIDVPGSELDDEQENIGNEDEENNFYSLGSDEQNDIEEENEINTP